MNDTDQAEEVVIQKPAPVPPQASAADTSNQDSKVSTDPSGERYIRTLSEKELA